MPDNATPTTFAIWTDCVSIGTTVIHKCRVYYGTEKAELACTEGFFSYSLPEVDVDGEFTDGYARWYNERHGTLLALCSHCDQRESQWDKRLRFVGAKNWPPAPGTWEAE